MKTLDSKVVVPVVDQNGQTIETQELRNTPLAELYGNKKVTLIQWDKEDRPTAEELLAPIAIKDGPMAKTEVYGRYAWGSAVKRAQTIGLTDDWVHKGGPVVMVEDGQRVQRWLLAQGIFGGFSGHVKIGIIQPGTMTTAGPVEDGFGYIRKSLFQKHARNERIVLGPSRDNWTYWQRLPWDQVGEYLIPMIQDAAAEANDPAKMLWASGHSYAYKQELYQADKNMIEHPFIAAGLNRASQSYFARLCSSVYLAGQYRIAVPTSEQVCWPGHHGKFVIDRSPVDSNGSIQAVETELSTDEEQRIGNMEVVQVTIASKDIMTKGCLGAVNDELLDGFDILVCSEDIKMVSPELGVLKEIRDSSEIELDVVVPFLAAWGPDSIVGVSARWAKSRMGLDHDGDAIRIVDCSDKEWLWDAVAALPEQETPKLPKSKRRIDEEDMRPEMIAKSMSNLVGMATNVAGQTYSVADRTVIAAMLGFKGVVEMDKRLNRWIKVGTDGFKTNLDMVAIEKEIAITQGNLRKTWGHTASWMGWDGSSWAFLRGLPPIIEGVIQPGETLIGYDHLDLEIGWIKEEGWFDPAPYVRYLVWGIEEPVALDDYQLKSAIWPEQTGTVAMIARYAIPEIMANWNESVPVRPLSGFVRWAVPTSEYVAKAAEKVQVWYNARALRVNWTDPKEIAAFKAALAEQVEETGCDRMEIANALWTLSHSTRSAESSGAMVFLACPEEAKRIVEEKPGLKEKQPEIILTGLNYQLPNFVSGELVCEVMDIAVLKAGKRIIRRGIVGIVEGQRAPMDKMLPENFLAFIAENCPQPEIGKIKLNIRQFGGKSWKALVF